MKDYHTKRVIIPTHLCEGVEWTGTQNAVHRGFVKFDMLSGSM